ncbi:MAG: hypothetical protein ACE5J0_00305 [Candidatus Paceibacterales bacterium]
MNNKKLLYLAIGLIFLIVIALVWYLPKEKTYTVTSDDNRLTLTVPRGVLPEGATFNDISITKLTEDKWTEDIKAIEPVGAVYSLEPDSLNFNQPVTVSLQLDEQEVADIQPEKGTRIYILFARDSDGTLRVLDNVFVRNSLAGGPVTVSAETTHFSDVGAAPLGVTITPNGGAPREPGPELPPEPLEIPKEEFEPAVEEEPLPPESSEPNWRVSSEFTNIDLYGLDPLDCFKVKEGPSLGEQFMGGSLGKVVGKVVKVAKACVGEEGLNVKIKMDNPFRGGPEASAALNVGVVIDLIRGEPETGLLPLELPEPEPEPVPEPAPEPPPLPEVPPEFPEPEEIEIPVDISVKSDPAKHDSGGNKYIGMPNKLNLKVLLASITIKGPYPWVDVTGSLVADGNFTATGRGTVAGFSNIAVTFKGTFTGTSLSGDYTMGAKEGLPTGQPIIYWVEG